MEGEVREVPVVVDRAGDVEARRVHRVVADVLSHSEAAAEGGAVLFDRAVALGEAAVEQPLALVEEVVDEEVEEPAGIEAEHGFVVGLEPQVAYDTEHPHERAVPAVVTSRLGLVGLGQDLIPEVAELEEADVGAEPDGAPSAVEVLAVGRVVERRERGVLCG